MRDELFFVVLLYAMCKVVYIKHTDTYTQSRCRHWHCIVHERLLYDITLGFLDQRHSNFNKEKQIM